jgi:hypothetical protein
LRRQIPIFYYIKKLDEPELALFAETMVFPIFISISPAFPCSFNLAPFDLGHYAAPQPVLADRFHGRSFLED